MPKMQAQINGCRYTCYLKGDKYHCAKTDDDLCGGKKRLTISAATFRGYCRSNLGELNGVRTCVRQERNKQGRLVCREYTKDYKMVSPKDVVCVMPGEGRPPASVPTVEIEHTALSPDESNVWHILGREERGRSASDIAKSTGMSLDRAKYTLTMLELKGLAAQQADDQYILRTFMLDPLHIGLIHSYSHPAGGEDIPASYQLLELAEVLPSHNPLNNFRWNPRYPKEIQDRDYSNPNLPFQAKVYEKAAKLDPSRVISTAKTSIEGPSIVVGDKNIVLSGNSRVLSIIFASAKHPAQYKKYVDYLIQHAPTYGFDPKVIKKMRQPILVRRVAIPPSQYKVFGSQANESPAMTLDLIGTLQSVAKYVPDDTVMTMDIADDETLRAYIGSSRGQRFARSIIEALPATKVGAYVDRGMLTEEGKALIEGVLFFKLIPSMETIEKMPKQLKNTVSFSIPEFFRIKIGSKSGQMPKEYDLTKDLHRAIRYFNANLLDAPLDFHLRQATFITEEDVWEEDKLWGQLVRLLDLHRGAAIKFRTVLRQYADQAEQLLIPQPGGPVGVLKELIDRDQKQKRVGKLSGYRAIAGLGLDIFEVMAEGMTGAKQRKRKRRK